MKLTKSEMELFTLGAALVGTNPEAAKIVARALDESTEMRRRIKAKRKRRPKQ